LHIFFWKLPDDGQVFTNEKIVHFSSINHSLTPLFTAPDRIILHLASGKIRFSFYCRGEYRLNTQFIHALSTSRSFRQPPRWKKRKGVVSFESLGGERSARFRAFRRLFIAHPLSFFAVAGAAQRTSVVTGSARQHDASHVEWVVKWLTVWPNRTVVVDSNFEVGTLLTVSQQDAMPSLE
jgi:hypothetical protein